jgi:N-carbamoyl-L-amino-acid hydrolase
VRKGLPPLSRSNIRGFIELHIEQGPVLASEDAPVGIVSSIRGTLRVRDGHCIGAYSHSGAVPQHMRRDAALATAELINRLDQRCEVLRTVGRDVVFAVGRLHTDAKIDGLTKVAGEVRFTVDLRSQERELLSELAMHMDQLAAEIGSRRNVQFSFGGRALAEPAIMEASFQTILSDSARALGVRAPQVACGAGHDAAEFVRAGIPSCMIFVRNTGESHNPDEHMEMSDFRLGVMLLAGFLARNISLR